MTSSQKTYRFVLIGLIIFLLCGATHQCEQNQNLSALLAKKDTCVVVHDTVIHHYHQELHHVTLTKYNPPIAQCDSTPLNTADGGYIDTVALQQGSLRWCVLLRDLLTRWGGPFNYGDIIHVYSPHMPPANGWWVVHDTMSKYTHDENGNLIVRTKWIDILQPMDSRIYGINRDVLLSNKPI